MAPKSIMKGKHTLRKRERVKIWLSSGYDLAPKVCVSSPLKRAFGNRQRPW